MIYEEEELVLSYYTQTGVMQAVFFSDLPITNGTGNCEPCNLKFDSGTNQVRILSRGDIISISRE